MKSKNIFSFLCALALIASLVVPAKASEPAGTIIDLGDGFYIVEVLEVLPSPHSSDTVSGIKSFYLYQNSVLIGTSTLGGVFDISGSTAKAISGDITGTGSNGWTYQGGSTSCSGNTVYGTATYKSSTGVTKSHSGSISCSPDGTLS
ncbi:MAG: hypothetical protein K2F83_00480 [Oscillospiraceae bacterium]|nr:hypothetical protein [Oscillospiraceae bacterium]